MLNTGHLDQTYDKKIEGLCFLNINYNNKSKIKTENATHSRFYETQVRGLLQWLRKCNPQLTFETFF